MNVRNIIVHETYETEIKGFIVHEADIETQCPECDKDWKRRVYLNNDGNIHANLHILELCDNCSTSIIVAGGIPPLPSNRQ